jgi:hypothetical protein
VGAEHVVGIHAVKISASSQVDAIEVTYQLSNGSLYTAPSRGNASDSSETILLGALSYVGKIEGKTDGTAINQLTITTIGPRYEVDVYGPYGKGGVAFFQFQGVVAGFHGTYSNRLDQIGVYSLENVRRAGHAYGSYVDGEVFDEFTDFRNPPIVGISKLLIRHHDYITSIQAEYLLLGGTPVLGKKHGGDEGDLTTVTFDRGEVVTNIQGHYDTYISQLTVFTMKEGGIPARYGPFGKQAFYNITIEGHVLGFFGRSSETLNSIGAYYT